MDNNASTDEQQPVVLETTVENFLTLLAAYGRLGGDSSDEDDDGDGVIDHQLPDNGAVVGNNEGASDLEEDDNDEGYDSFLIENSSDDDELGGQEADQLGEVYNGGNFAFTTMGAVETHNYEDAIIVGRSSSSSSTDANSSSSPSSSLVVPQSEEDFTSSSLRRRRRNDDDDEEHRRAVERALEPRRAYESHYEFVTSTMFWRLMPAGEGQRRPASAAAVAALEKRKFGGGAEQCCCAICLEDYEVGDDMSVMPCSDRHSFHQACLAEWLARSRFCPLCRHELPAGENSTDSMYV